jgi:hydrogenase maturation protease
MQDADIAILVDAISTGSPPGTIRIYDPLPDLPISTSGKTAHGFGVAETIALARHAGTYLPDRIILVGIEGQRFEMGGTLSNPVIRSLSKAASEIQRLISVFSQS